MAERDIHRSIEAVFRIERARLIAVLARMTRDVGLAEDLAQDALVAALAEWPRVGMPANPGAWLTATAKRRAIDGFRHATMTGLKHAEIGRDLEGGAHDPAAAIATALDDDIGDELLALIFAACHPVLSPEQRTAMTLRLVGGLTTEEIARAYLTAEPTIAQRIVRAKRTLAEAGVAFEVPRGAERDERLGSVLQVLYLIFNEGYAPTSGPALTRPALCAEAQRLARILARLAADEPEALGLLSLMEIQASRLATRARPEGGLIPITEQNRARWDALLIRRGLAALERAVALGGADGPYVLQAALAACHARAQRAEDTDWRAIAALYDRLLTVTRSPIVAVGRAVAHGMAFGPEAGLALLDELAGAPALKSYAPFCAARADCLLRAGRAAEAAAAFEAAATMTKNEAERAFLMARAAGC